MNKNLELAKELVNSKVHIVNEIRKVIVGHDEVLETPIPINHPR